RPASTMGEDVFRNRNGPNLQGHPRRLGHPG
ncbi:IclR family transcriptional regulator, partial [Burkholderia pseudomallei]